MRARRSVSAANAAPEVFGSKEIEDGANHLVRLHKLIVEHNKTEKQMPIREPDLKIVLTGGQYGYTRNDGVHVIPLACLRD